MENKVGILGLGYVGLPLAVESGKIYSTIGFDIDQNRIEELRTGFDRTLEVSREELGEVKNLTYTSEKKDLDRCNLYIITVPTPIDVNNNPNLDPLIDATETVASVLKPGDIVVYESTVFPGCTEEVCVPILEGVSGLKFNKDFFCGYSPERINPGDKNHKITNIPKVISGSDERTAKKIDNFYKSFIVAGTHLASSIKVAEALKWIVDNKS